jgi:hypothetical protein
MGEQEEEGGEVRLVYECILHIFLCFFLQNEAALPLHKLMHAAFYCKILNKVLHDYYNSRITQDLNMNKPPK